MFNIEKPPITELPSLSQLRRYTVMAIIAALAILVAMVLPAEYGTDLTGAGRLLGLTEMGEIKQELKYEAEQDELIHGDGQSSNLINTLTIETLLGAFIGIAHAEESWQDSITFTLAPGEHTEIKLVMIEGDQAQFSWHATGGRINFDLHAHGDGQSTTYEKARGATEGEGEIKAQFVGEHGWFWRNRDDSSVTVTLHLRGNYSRIVQAE